jgi:hypothetical protein
MISAQEERQVTDNEHNRKSQMPALHIVAQSGPYEHVLNMGRLWLEGEILLLTADNQVVLRHLNEHSSKPMLQNAA